MASLEKFRPPVTEDPQQTLFDRGDSWEEHWWDMPAFDMDNCIPQYEIKVCFMTYEDVQEFMKLIKATKGPAQGSIWYPEQILDQPREWCYVQE